MPKFLVELWLDGYETEKEMKEACEEFIYEQLNMTASSVKITKIFEPKSSSSEEEKIERDDFEKKMDYFSGIEKENNFITTWSLYDELEDINEKYYFEDVRLMKYEGFEEEVLGSTWLDLWRAADKLVRKSEDYHHIFIDGFDETDVHTVKLVTGS